MSVEKQLQDDYDPFEVFDRYIGGGTVRDPYPEWSRLRRESPVVEQDPRKVFGLADDVELPEGMPRTFQVLNLDGVLQVLRDGVTFSSTGYAMSMGVVMGHTILEMDEPEHHAYRGLVQQAFTRKAMERWEVDLVAPIVHRHIDAFAERGTAGDAAGGAARAAVRGTADLVSELTFPFPVHVIAAMLGLPAADLPMFHRLAVQLISLSFDWDRAMVASEALRDYFAGILAERRQHPQGDVISVLAGAELEGQRLTDDEIYAFLRLLLPAGAETTYRSSSNLLFGLLTNPDQLDAVRKDRSLIPMAIEEGLRWEPPLTGIMRVATRDTSLSGVAIPSGSVISVAVGPANRDEAYWDEPEHFDIFRPAKPHAAFASGPHMCLGMHLARMETTVVLNALFDRLPNLRLDPDATDVHVTGLTFRAPRSLPVVFG